VTDAILHVQSDGQLSKEKIAPKTPDRLVVKSLGTPKASQTTAALNRERGGLREKSDLVELLLLRWGGGKKGGGVSGWFFVVFFPLGTNDAGGSCGSQKALPPSRPSTSPSLPAA
jgi:hypothetical protein